MPLAIDTLKFSNRLQSAGMPRKQADVLVEVLSDVMIDYPSKDAVIKAVETLGHSIDRRFASVDTRFTSVDKQLTSIDNQLTSIDNQLTSIDKHITSMQDEHQSDMARIEGKQDEQRSDMARIEGKQDEQRSDMARIEALLTKILEGQAVLSQNDMELKRRLDER